jgi:tetratricopeptide (TPR) repeat protein
MVMGRQDEALEQIHKALELDPFNGGVQSFHAVILMNAGRYEEAVAVARKVLSGQPDIPVARVALLDSLFKLGRYDELAALDRARWVKDPELTAALDRGIAEHGYARTVKSLVDILASRHGKPGSTSSTHSLSLGYARAGDKDATLEWLERAYREHDNNLAYIGVNRAFEFLHSDPRFQDLVRRVGVRIIE